MSRVRQGLAVAMAAGGLAVAGSLAAPSTAVANADGVQGAGHDAGDAAHEVVWRIWNEQGPCTTCWPTWV